MSSRGRYEDASTLLFLVPFIASGGYAIYLWVTAGLNVVLPSSVYLQVTRDPYVFLVSVLAVLAAVVIDLSGVEPKGRRDRLAWASGYLLKTAAACFLLSLLMAWYSNGFVDVTAAADDFVVGRYSIVFPAFLVLFSYLVNPSLKLAGGVNLRVVGFILMLAVPAVIYEVGKRDAVVGLGIATVMTLAGLYLFVRTASSAAGSPA